MPISSPQLARNSDTLYKQLTETPILLVQGTKPDSIFSKREMTKQMTLGKWPKLLNTRVGKIVGDKTM
jgi:hypothetical protein